jgi:hypothetical protein
LIYSSYDELSRKIFSPRARKCEKQGGAETKTGFEEPFLYCLGRMALIQAILQGRETMNIICLRGSYFKRHEESAKCEERG